MWWNKQNRQRFSRVKAEKLTLDRMRCVFYWTHPIIAGTKIVKNTFFIPRHIVISSISFCAINTSIMQINSLVVLDHLQHVLLQCAVFERVFKLSDRIVSYRRKDAFRIFLRVSSLFIACSQQNVYDYKRMYNRCAVLVRCRWSDQYSHGDWKLLWLSTRLNSFSVPLQ